MWEQPGVGEPGCFGNESSDGDIQLLAVPHVPDAIVTSASGIVTSVAGVAIVNNESLLTRG